MTPVATRLTCLLTALLAAWLAVGCHRSSNPVAEAAIRSATLGTSDGAQDGQQALRAHDEGGSRAASLPLPPHFPGDVYLPERYRVNSVLDLEGASVLSLSAPGDVSTLFSDARSQMRAQGWQQVLAAQHTADTAMLAFEKRGDAGVRNATLSFNRNNGDERVIVGVQLRDQL